jgi:hypothetical protein
MLLKMCKDIIAPYLTTFCKSPEARSGSAQSVLIPHSQRLFPNLSPPSALQGRYHDYPAQKVRSLLKGQKLETDRALVPNRQVV